jgi:hypothetical protein
MRAAQEGMKDTKSERTPRRLIPPSRFSAAPTHFHSLAPSSPFPLFVSFLTEKRKRFPTKNDTRIE